MESLATKADTMTMPSLKEKGKANRKGKEEKVVGQRADPPTALGDELLGG